MRSLAIALLASSFVALGGCSGSNSTSPDAAPAEPAVRVEPDTRESPESINPQFTDVMRRAAAEYRGWGRVDERPNLAPILCRAPEGLDHGFPSHARLSEADDGPHERKLYYLFAGLEGRSARELYAALGSPEAKQIPVGFTIVKQSWHAIPGEQPVPSEPQVVAEQYATTDAPAPITWVERDGKRLDVGEQAELFVMAKVGSPDMPGTDAGWVYGTLDASGQTVTSAGLVPRCMDCHTAADHERLFGLQTTKAFAKIKPSKGVNGQRELPASLGLEP